MVLNFNRSWNNLLFNSNQVTGTVRVNKGNVINGRKSPYSLYNEELATYTKEDAFNQEAAVGFIEILVYQLK